MCSVFEWSSYLYSTGGVTLYNWEGEVYDFWADDEAALLKMKDLIATFELVETKAGE